MRGIQFVIDESGNKRAVQIDLDTWGDLWEDFYDAALARDRAGEPDEDWENVRELLHGSREEITEAQ